MANPYWKQDTLQKIFWVVVGGMVLTQVVAYLLNQMFGVGGNVRLGMGFMLLIIAGIIMIALTLVMRAERENFVMSKVNMVIMLIAIAILIFLLLNIKAFVPEIFEQAVFDMQSIFSLV